LTGFKGGLPNDTEERKEPMNKEEKPMIAMREQLPPEGEVVFTHIDDENGLRNEALLRRRGGLMYFPDDSMYVYYAPTHWRPATVKELERVRGEFQSAAAGSLKARQ
jgi:hypothetical protein